VRGAVDDFVGDHALDRARADAKREGGRFFVVEELSTGTGTVVITTESGDEAGLRAEDGFGMARVYGE
jgi:hypothetical protein